MMAVCRRERRRFLSPDITDYELCICGKPILGSSSTHDDGSEIDVIGHIALADMCPGFNTDE